MESVDDTKLISDAPGPWPQRQVTKMWGPGYLQGLSQTEHFVTVF